MFNFRGHPLNSLKGDVRQNLKMAYCLELHFKHYMMFFLYEIESIKVSGFRPFKFPYYVINFHFVDIS